MAFRRNAINIWIRLVLLVATAFALAYVVQLDGYWVVKINLSVALVVETYLFFRFLRKWRKDVAVFADSVSLNDYSITFRGNTTQDFPELYDILNNVSNHVQKVKSEYVQQNYYFQYVVENAQVGLLAYDENGNVLLVNRVTLEYAAVADLKRMDQLRDLNLEFYQQITALELNQPHLIILSKGEIKKLSARLAKLTIDGKPLFLLSLLNIRSELEAAELQSWQDLINVLTHEIMNSVTPISSLSGSLAKYLDRIEGNTQTIEKAKNSLDVIRRRSAALMEFVSRYRAISNVPLPQLAEVNLPDLISSVLSLLEAELSDIHVTTSHHDEKLWCDRTQVEQVLINLVRNAIQALEERSQRKIAIVVQQTDHATLLTVSDTGKGINPLVQDKIFTPFFTTRQGGSGIGLTLSRQIMHRHNGQILVRSHEGEGSAFTLVFSRPNAHHSDAKISTPGQRIGGSDAAFV